MRSMPRSMKEGKTSEEKNRRSQCHYKEIERCPCQERSCEKTEGPSRTIRIVRSRGWMTSEIELEGTAKEAEKSKVQLIKERKSMTEELNKMKQELRKTATTREREQTTAKQEKLQSELDIRNAQISELQQQILGMEQEKWKESKVNRWTRLVSMVEAKLSVQYLFAQATEAMASAATKTTELKEVTAQYDKLREGRNKPREQISRMKRIHEDEVVRLETDHEEKIPQTYITKLA